MKFALVLSLFLGSFAFAQIVPTDPLQNVGHRLKAMVPPGETQGLAPYGAKCFVDSLIVTNEDNGDLISITASGRIYDRHGQQVIREAKVVFPFDGSEDLVPGGSQYLAQIDSADQTRAFRAYDAGKGNIYVYVKDAQGSVACRFKR